MRLERLRRSGVAAGTVLGVRVALATLGLMDARWRVNRPPVREFIRPMKVRNAVRRRRFVRSLAHVPLDLHEPVEWLGGRDYGGYWCPIERVRRNGVAYTLGAGTDVSFDLALIERTGCDVFTFDPAEASARYVHSIENRKLHFSQVAIWSHDGTLTMYRAATPWHPALSAANLQNTNSIVEVPCRSIDSLMAEFGHTRIDVLKYHVEGSEYEVFEPAALERWHVDVLIINLFHTRSPTEALGLLNAVRDRGYAVVARHAHSITLVRDERRGAPSTRDVPEHVGHWS